MSTYAQIRAEIARLEQQKVEAFRREYPVGRVVDYSHGRQVRTVMILRHSIHGCRVLVSGTDHDYWLDGDRIVGADEEEE